MDKKGRTEADGKKESEWPRVLRIGSGEEFRQTFAVAHLAMKLAELARANPTVKPEDKLKLLPEKFLDEAWKLIEGEHARVLRPQTNKEYLAAHGRSDEAMEEVVGHSLQQQEPVPFKTLYDPERNAGDKEDKEIIQLHDDETGKPIEVKWRVYTTKKAFDDLYCAYQRGIREGRKKEFSLAPEHYDKGRIEAELADVRSKIKKHEDAFAGANALAREQLKKELEGLGVKRMDLEERKHFVDLVSDDERPGTTAQQISQRSRKGNKNALR